MKVPASSCRNKLTFVWFLGAGLIFAVLVVQSLNEKIYGDRTEEVWAWFRPLVLPTLSLIVGVMALSITRNVPDREVDRFVFRLAMALSVVYLLTVALPLLAEPLVDGTALDLMERSNLWLIPFQGLVTAALGAFFVAGEETGGAKRHRPEPTDKPDAIASRRFHCLAFILLTLAMVGFGARYSFVNRREGSFRRAWVPEWSESALLAFAGGCALRYEDLLVSGSPLFGLSTFCSERSFCS